MKTSRNYSLALNHQVVHALGMNTQMKRILLTASFLFISLILFAGCNMESTKNTNSGAEMAAPGGDKYVTQTKETQSKTTPDMAVQMLKDGNKRFVDNKMIDRDLIAQVEQTSTGQYPIAAVVSCIDSRIPTEIVFDQGVGDIFNARIAGNFVNTDILGSLEFACKAAGAKAIVVMGHTECGAVKGACDNVEMGNLTATLDNIEPAINAVTDIKENRNSKNAEFVQKVADKNVELTIEKIKSDSDVLREMYENGEITIVGAMYHVESGKVTFME
jgi:carbonic anhydrase